MPDSPSIDTSSILSWISTGLIAAFTALTTGIAALWKNGETKNALAIAKQEERHAEEIKKLEARLSDSEKRHQECEEGRFELSTSLAGLKTEVDSLKSRIA